MKKLKLIGIDSWSRPVYQDESGKFWKDINLGIGKPYLHNAVNNDFDGEPDMPIKEEFEIIKEEHLKKFEFFIDDLTEKAKAQFIKFLEGDNGNHDVIPICTYETVCEATNCEDCEWECTNEKRGGS